MISLLYSGNENVFRGLLISLLSAARQTREPLDVHVLTMDLTGIDPFYKPISQRQTDYLQHLLQGRLPGSRVTRYDVTQAFLRDMKDSPNLRSSYTPYTFLRLFCDELPVPERVLYLDTDTAFLKDPALLFYTDLKNCDFAGVRDHLGRFFINRSYINAGVLLLNVAQLKKDGFLARVRSLCATKKMPFPDQDALNRLEKHKLFLPRRFNEQYRIMPDTVVRHFSKTIRWFPFFHTLNIKPWEIERLHSEYRCHELDEVLAEYQRCLAQWQQLQP